LLFGMKLTWGFPATGALDTAYTEIQVSPDGVANIAQLGLFAYPTTTHSIQGMQPNLTQKYRGRLIDRIGNIGPWSEWATGTTSADASAVLDILSGQLSESQLSQGLIEKIENSDLENNQAFIDVQQKIEGLDAQYYLRIQSGKYVSGFGLGVEGGRSDFIVHSDSFALGNPAGGDEGVSYPFNFRATAYTDPVTDTVFPVGAYLKSAFIDYASIDTAHIKQLAVKSAQIADAAITTAKIGDLQVDTLKIKDRAVTVPINIQKQALGIQSVTRTSAGTYTVSDFFRAEVVGLEPNAQVMVFISTSASVTNRIENIGQASSYSISAEIRATANNVVVFTDKLQRDNTAGGQLYGNVTASFGSPQFPVMALATADSSGKLTISISGVFYSNRGGVLNQYEHSVATISAVELKK